ncbi:hypothetical protein LEMLEM_LOCUS6312, partial [Lemmus lemmus]
CSLDSEVHLTVKGRHWKNTLECLGSLSLHWEQFDCSNYSQPLPAPEPHGFPSSMMLSEQRSPDRLCLLVAKRCVAPLRNNFMACAGSCWQHGGIF